MTIRPRSGSQRIEPAVRRNFDLCLPISNSGRRHEPESYLVLPATPCAAARRPRTTPGLKKLLNCGNELDKSFTVNKRRKKRTQNELNLTQNELKMCRVRPRSGESHNSCLGLGLVSGMFFAGLEKDNKIVGTNSGSLLESIKVWKNELKTNSI